MKSLAVMIVAIVSAGAALSGLLGPTPDPDRPTEPICHCRVPVDCRTYRQPRPPGPTREGRPERAGTTRVDPEGG